jgi:hypothetical protein
MRRTLRVVVLVTLAGVAWFFIAPRLAAKHLRDAALAGDVAGIDQVVDFPAVRAGLEADLKTGIQSRAASSARGNPLGTALVEGASGLLVDRLLQRFVTARGIITLARYGGIDSTLNPGETEIVSMGNRGPATFAVTLSNSRRPAQNTVTFLFGLSGLSWRLVRLEIPSIAH